MKSIRCLLGFHNFWRRVEYQNGVFVRHFDRCERCGLERSPGPPKPMPSEPPPRDPTLTGYFDCARTQGTVYDTGKPVPPRRDVRNASLRATERQAEEAVRRYRETHPDIARHWRERDLAKNDDLTNPLHPMNPMGLTSPISSFNSFDSGSSSSSCDSSSSSSDGGSCGGGD